MTGVSYGILRQVVERTLPDPYRFFRVQKRSGGYRQICVPQPSLFRVQKWIAKYVLRNSQGRIHTSSRAFAPKQSVVGCAEQHCGCTWLVKVDIQQFFESISERQAYYAFRRLGYQRLISFELARICTRVAESAPGRYRHIRWGNRSEATTSTVLTGYASPRVGNLPQGAPTSPMLSNLAMWRLDEGIAALAAESGLVYTRYADDLIFSTAADDYTRAKAEELIRKVYEQMLPFGLRPRTTKTVIAPPGARKIVLGLLVDRDRPRLRREFRATLEQHVYCLAKNGPATHAQRRGFRSIFSLQQYVTGLLNYATQVDPDYAAPLWEQFGTVNWPY